MQVTLLAKGLLRARAQVYYYSISFCTTYVKGQIKINEIKMKWNCREVLRHLCSRGHGNPDSRVRSPRTAWAQAPRLIKLKIKNLRNVWYLICYIKSCFGYVIKRAINHSECFPADQSEIPRCPSYEGLGRGRRCLGYHNKIRNSFTYVPGRLFWLSQSQFPVVYVNVVKTLRRTYSFFQTRIAKTAYNLI